jgi:hypothetical protein
MLYHSYRIDISTYVVVVHSRAFGFYPLGSDSDRGQVRIDALYQRRVLLPDIHGNTVNTARFSPFFFRVVPRLSRVLSHYSRNRDVSWIRVRAIQQSASDRGGFASNTVILPESSFRTPFRIVIPRRALITARVSKCDTISAAIFCAPHCHNGQCFLSRIAQ